ncbi:RNA polymerase I associated factor, A49-like protein [Crucibulum laeve]|uniref:RNA polymerase I associated factor, A49-like protein n=1 Tax=Crucibulum laeve TaxID=68775 RepID=A0A5C3M971_9AGAR|nr:RNA polymerase I associated factor, A49-like protein [Crucibulum laeve]
MPTAKVSKKRRRESTPAESLAFKLSASNTGAIGPTIVSYPALQAPSATPFKCYARKKSKTGGKSQEDDDNEDDRGIILAGETDSVEFVSNEEESRKVADGGCHYLLAVHNRKTGSISLLPVPKSPHILTHTVKALKSLPSSAAPSKLQYREARTTLGDTFGTKKAKSAIKAQERNRVDVSAMEGVMDYLMDGIDKGAQGLMSTDEAKTAADNNRLIPPFSSTATDPAEVYPLQDIIAEAEWKAISVSAFDEAANDGERIALLPFRYSEWLKWHVKALAHETGKAKKKNMKIIFYISAMLAFRQTVARKEVTKDQVYEKLASVPGIIVDSLLARFTETARDSTSHQSTSATQTNLLTHIFALCLKVDNYATDTSMMAKDLGMKITEINQLFKSLGCKVIVLGERERTRLGLPDSGAKIKRAVLNAPVEFPKPKLKRKT